MNRILITGVGAIIGYGLLRSFRALKTDYFLVGADIFPDAVGQAWTDAFECAPLTNTDQYQSWLEGLLQKYQFDMVIPGIEQDLRFFNEHRGLFAQYHTQVVLNAPRLIELSQDKWLMDQELSSIQSPARIPSSNAGSFAELESQLGIPFLLKPRQGYASKGIVRVDNEAQFRQHGGKLGAELIAQRMVGDDDNEYTVGVFGDGKGSVAASISLLRKLAADGSTAKAWVSKEPGLDAQVEQLCEHFKPLGPTNLQFRREGSDWLLLEINPRVSSSTSLRAAFGYNEAQMCVEHYLKGRAVSQPEIRPGFAARYIEDAVVYDRSNF